MNSAILKTNIKIEQHFMSTLPLGGADVGLIFGDLREGGQLVHLLEAAQAVAQASSLGGDHNHRAATSTFNFDSIQF